MSHDEVVRSEGVGGWGLVLVVAVVAALFSMVSQPHRGSSSPAPGVLPSAPPSATAVASTPPSSTPPAPPSEAPPSSLNPTQAALLQTGGFVTVADICEVATDHHSALTIGLVLHNDTQVTERLEELTPALAYGGLKDKGVRIRSGTCATPFGTPAKAAGQVLPSDTTVLVTMHLGLPKTCPIGLPVGLDVTVSIDGNVRAERVAVLPDLGQLTFTTCGTNS